MAIPCCGRPPKRVKNPPKATRRRLWATVKSRGLSWRRGSSQEFIVAGVECGDVVSGGAGPVWFGWQPGPATLKWPPT